MFTALCKCCEVNNKEDFDLHQTEIKIDKMLRGKKLKNSKANNNSKIQDSKLILNNNIKVNLPESNKYNINKIGLQSETENVYSTYLDTKDNDKNEEDKLNLRNKQSTNKETNYLSEFNGLNNENNKKMAISTKYDSVKPKENRKIMESLNNILISNSNLSSKRNILTQSCENTDNLKSLLNDKKQTKYKSLLNNLNRANKSKSNNFNGIVFDNNDSSALNVNYTYSNNIMSILNNKNDNIKNKDDAYYYNDIGIGNTYEINEFVNQNTMPQKPLLNKYTNTIEKISQVIFLTDKKSPEKRIKNLYLKLNSNENSDNSELSLNSRIKHDREDNDSDTEKISHSFIPKFNKQFSGNSLERKINFEGIEEDMYSINNTNSKVNKGINHIINNDVVVKKKTNSNECYYDFINKSNNKEKLKEIRLKQIEEEEFNNNIDYAFKILKNHILDSENNMRFTKRGIILKFNQCLQYSTNKVLVNYDKDFIFKYLLLEDRGLCMNNTFINNFGINNADINKKDIRKDKANFCYNKSLTNNANNTRNEMNIMNNTTENSDSILYKIEFFMYLSKIIFKIYIIINIIKILLNR